MNTSWDISWLFMKATPQTTPMTFQIVTAEEYVLLNEIVATVTMFMTMAGFVGNAINIRTFIAMGVEDGATATFLALSFADLAYTLATFLQSGAYIMESTERRRGQMFTLDPFVIALFSANIGMATLVGVSLNTTYLAVVRCLCVAMPLQFKTMFTKARSYIVLISFPVIAIVSHAPLFSRMGVASKFDPVTNSTRIVVWLSDDRKNVKDITRFIFMNSVPFASMVIVIVCAVIMTIKIRKSVQFRGKRKHICSGTENEAQKLSGKELNVVIQVIVISSVYIFCTACKMAMTFTFVMKPKFDIGRHYHYLYLLLSVCLTASDSINSSVNFCVYLRFNSKFRSQCLSRCYVKIQKDVKLVSQRKA